MNASRTTIRAAMAALALLAAPAAHASVTYHAAPKYGPAMSTAQIRVMQAEGVREIVIKRLPGLSSSQQAAVRAQAGVSYLGPGPLPNTELDRAPAGRLAAAVAALREDPQVQYAEPNGEMHATSAPNDPGFHLQWALENTGQLVYDTRGTPGDDIGATYAWQHSTGANVTVAVVDTGADYAAAADDANDLHGRLLAGQDFADSANDPQDQNGHGTHVSGIIAADQDNGVGVSGVAPAASVLPMRVLDASGMGSTSNVANAFNSAGVQGIPIVNASLGGVGASELLADAVISHPHTLYVVAAGNGDANGNGYDVDTTPFYPCDIPAANLICVGASDQNDEPAPFSNYGATNVDLFAPGVNILSTWLSGQYAYADGTSMATPMVSGTLALMLSRNPNLTADALKADLLASVDPSPDLAGTSASGGDLDAAAAVASAGGDAPYAAPGNRERPQVNGAATVGSTLSATSGAWSRQPTAYTYQWERCVVGTCLPVPGATAPTYTLTTGDYGAVFAVQVSAGNAFGSTQAISAFTVTVDIPGQDSAPATGSSTTSPTTGPATPSAPGAGPPAPSAGPTLRLTKVGLRGTGRRRALVFTVSAQTRVQITVAPCGRVRRAAADVLRVALSAHRGQNRYALNTLLHARRLARGTYTLTVRAGGRTVALRVTV